MFNIKNSKNRKEVVLFLKRHPNPTDMRLHKWAEHKKYNIHKVEELMYRIATEHIKEKKGKWR